MNTKIAVSLSLFFLSCAPQSLARLTPRQETIVSDCRNEEEDKLRDGLAKIASGLSAVVFNTKGEFSLYPYLLKVNDANRRAALKSFSYDATNDSEIAEIFPKPALHLYMGIKTILDDLKRQLELVIAKSRPLTDRLTEELIANSQFKLSCGNLEKAFNKLKETDKNLVAIQRTIFLTLAEKAFHLITLLGITGSEFMQQLREASEEDLEEIFTQFTEFGPKMLAAGAVIAQVASQIQKDIL